jgi:hypothetical protein
MLIDVGQPRAKWQVGGVVQERLSSASTEYLQVPVFAASGGQPVNPTSYTVRMAFEAGINAPATGDWVAASWDTTDIGSYVAQCLIGTGGVTALTAGAYYVWLSIATATETVIRPAGTIVVS